MSGKYDSINIQNNRLLEEFRNGSAEALDKLIRINRKLICRIAENFKNVSGVEVDDLIQVASIAFYKAAYVFDPSWSTKYSTFASSNATNYIRNYIRDFSNSVKIPRSVYVKTRKYGIAEEQLIHEKGRVPSISEVREYLDIETLDMMRYSEVTSCYSLDSIIDEGENGTFHDIVSDKYEEDSLSLELRTVLQNLPPIIQDAVIMYHVHGYNFAEVAEIIGSNKMTVNRYIKAAITILKSEMSGIYPQSDMPRYLLAYQLFEQGFSDKRVALNLGIDLNDAKFYYRIWDRQDMRDYYATELLSM